MRAAALSLILFSSLFLLSHCGDLQADQLADAAQKKALCNDGTPPVYYKHLNENSSEWLIFLEGGGGCFSEADCLKRYQHSRRLMTASFDVIPRSVTGGGVLSLDCNVNPHFCNANIFFIHYCSSDLYSGDMEYEYKGSPVYFKGKIIVEEVINQIAHKHPQLAQATRIVFGG